LLVVKSLAMISLRRLVLVAAVFAVSACGGGAEPAKEAEALPKEPAEAAEPAPEPSKEPAAEEKTESAKPEEAPPSEEKAREITYTQSPEGLKVDVAGVRFMATASTVRAGDGWGVKVKVKATAEDDKPHKLLSPKNGPLAFAGKVERGGQTEKLGDERSGDDEKTVEKSGLEFSRDWPGKSGTKGLKTGDKLELQVGLWGLGESSDALRPVRQFMVVKMVAGKHKPQPVVSPPPTAASSEE
jgi:hypothetical protein